MTATYDEETLRRFFTLTPDDLALVRTARGDHNRLGLALLLVWTRVERVIVSNPATLPEAVIAHVGHQLGLTPAALRGYGATGSAPPRTRSMPASRAPTRGSAPSPRGTSVGCAPTRTARPRTQAIPPRSWTPPPSGSSAKACSARLARRRSSASSTRPAPRSRRTSSRASPASSTRRTARASTPFRGQGRRRPLTSADERSLHRYFYRATHRVQSHARHGLRLGGGHLGRQRQVQEAGEKRPWARGRRTGGGREGGVAEVCASAVRQSRGDALRNSQTNLGEERCSPKSRSRFSNQLLLLLYRYIGASGAGADTRAGPLPARAPAAVAVGGRDCVGSRRSRVVFVPSFAVYLQLSTMVCAVCGNAGSPDLDRNFCKFAVEDTTLYWQDMCQHERHGSKDNKPCAHILLWYNGGTYGANSPYL